MKIKKTFLAIILSVAFIAPLVSLANNMMGGTGDYGYGMGMMGGWGTGWGSFWFLIMSLGALAWVGVGVLLAVWLFKQIGKK